MSEEFIRLQEEIMQKRIVEEQLHHTMTNNASLEAELRRRDVLSPRFETERSATLQ